MKRVLSIVSYNFLPPKMGGQKGIALFYKFLVPHISLTCVTTRSNDPTYAQNYELLNILSNSKFRYINIIYFFPLRKIIKQKRITHLILEHPYYGWLGLLLKWCCGVKLIVHSHNIEAVRSKTTNKWWWRILWTYERSVHRKADTNFFITDEDKEYAIKKFRLSPTKCFTVTYGFELTAPPSKEEKYSAREMINAQYHIMAEEMIILFNGTLSYGPNLEALKIILNRINPVLFEKEDFRYKIIICGKGLPKELNELKDHAAQNIIYAGFVNDISLYFKAADIFINPVIDGGGIKTKLVEALGYNINVVTTHSGAIGVPTDITGNKMAIISDDDWDTFAESIYTSNISLSIPKEFFDHFYWGNIAKKALEAI